VAVAMIGVMVPSVFAQIEVTVTPHKESHHIDQPNHFTVELSKVIPNTELCYTIEQNEKIIFFSHPIKFYNSDNVILLDMTDANWTLNESSVNKELEPGEYTVSVYYGDGQCNTENNFGYGSTQVIFDNELTNLGKFMQQNYFPEKIDVGFPGMTVNFSNINLFTSNFFNPPDVLVESSVTQEWGGGIIVVVSKIIISDDILEDIKSRNPTYDNPDPDSSFWCSSSNYPNKETGYQMSKYWKVKYCHNGDTAIHVFVESRAHPNTNTQYGVFMDAIIKKIISSPIPSQFELSSLSTPAQDSTLQKTSDNSKLLGIASFVDQSKDPQHYIDRYNNEITYKEWFDENYPQYSSIYEAVGLDESFVEPIVTIEPTVIDTELPICGSGVIGQCQRVQTEEPEDTPEQVDGEVICRPGTEPGKTICEVVQTTTTETSEGGGCLIATATYGSEMATEVQQLRELRDNQLLNTESGTAFMGMFNDIYYTFSPAIADMEREHPMFKEAVKLTITPMISSLAIMENAKSESEVLSIGISVIMLNIGMYLGVPAIVIVGIRKINHIN
jgi:hypothetical protein